MVGIGAPICKCGEECEALTDKLCLQCNKNKMAHEQQLKDAQSQLDKDHNDYIKESLRILLRKIEDHKTKIGEFEKEIEDIVKNGKKKVRYEGESW